MIKELATEHFKVNLMSPFTDGGQKRVCLGENNQRGGNNVIYFDHDQIKELIRLMKLADSEFLE